MTLSKHSAPGQSAGYLFQPERALYWLAKSERGGMVGVETTDDVVSKGANGISTYEQDKSTTSPRKNPLSDKSVHLWKTLGIWAQALNSGEIQATDARFVIATTATIPECLAKELGKEAKLDEDVRRCVKRLRAIGPTCSKSITSHVSSVLACTDDALRALIKRISLIDGAASSSGPALRTKLLSALHVPDHLPEEDILHNLYGWLCETLLDLWRNQKPGWITHEQFVRQRHQVIRLFDRRAFRERARELLPVTEEDRKANRERPFVKQLLLILEEEDNDLLLSAIDDFVRCLNERARLTTQGNLTREDLRSFDGRLRDRWEIIAKRITLPHRGELDEAQARKLGSEILLDTIDHRESLAGHPTEEYYMTRGSYHRLADLLRIGWHPDYKALMKARP